MYEMNTRVTRLMVYPCDALLRKDFSFSVSIEEEEGEEYVKIESNMTGGSIEINPCEWNELKSAIDTMILQCEAPNE